MKRAFTIIAAVAALPCLMGATITLDTATPNPGGFPGQLYELGTWTLGQNEAFTSIQARAVHGQDEPIVVAASANPETWAWWKQFGIAPNTYSCYGRFYYVIPDRPTTYIDSTTKEVTVQ